MDAKVGIVVVTFNRSDVTNLALDSLLRARNERSRFKVFLVDNASSLVEFQRIERFFSYLCAQHGLDGVLTRNEQNLGYAAGNNVGIRQALADPQITHLCLLNNDVIVSDGWLDRLVEKAPGALVGPVSNCVGNEQLISVDYQSQGTNGHTTLEVQKFARRWAEEHRGNVEGSRMLGFFCVLGERQLFESVGLLDENFRLGFFEDDDYCLRCVKAGWLLRIVREAFVHHWGSASFSRLPPAEFSALFRRNRQLFEEKHGAKWTQPSHDSWQRALVHELTWLTAQGASEPRLVETIKQWSLRLGGVNASAQPLSARLKADMLEALGRLSPRLPALVPPLRGLLSKADAGLRMPVRAARALRGRVYDLGRTLGIPQSFSERRFARSKRSGTLIIGPNKDPPGSRQRTQQLVEGFVQAGFEVFSLEPKLHAQLRARRLPSGVIAIELPSGDFSNFHTTGLTPREAHDILSLLRERLLGAERMRQATLILQSPFWAELAREFSGRVIYDRTDDPADTGAATLEVEMLESQLLRDASSIVVSSDSLKSLLCERDPTLASKLQVLRASGIYSS